MDLKNLATTFVDSAFRQKVKKIPPIQLCTPSGMVGLFVMNILCTLACVL